MMYSLYTNYNDMIQELNNIKKCKDKKYLYELVNMIISPYGNRLKAYILEEYIESEWIDIHSVYYGKQRKSISNKTIRIHFIFDNIDNINEVKEENYYGYITLRPICNDNLTISRIRLRYDKAYYNSDNLFVIKQETEVSFPHQQIKYLSFPFFRQDGMVTVCAHADIHMLVKTMHNVHKFNNYGIANILNKLNSVYGRDVPNEGLSIYEMLSALKARGFNPMLTKFTNAEYLLDEKNHIYSIFEFLDSMIESQLPVILAFKGHVVLISGASRNKYGEFNRYLVYDDSGYHLKQMTKLEKEDTFPNHSRLISKESIKAMIIAKGDNEKENCFVLVPTYKSLFYRYKYVSYHIKNMYEIMVGDETDINYSIILVDAKKLKIHLNKIGVSSYNNVLLPRYVWFVEFYDLDGVMRIILIDAMAHQYDISLPIILDIDMKNYVDVNNVNKLILLKEIL